MAFLMSDLAAGSTAVRQLENNMNASQYDAANAKANADEAQEKVKQDKLKTEQEQLDINKTRLANIVTQSGIDMNSRTQAAIAEVRNDPKYKTATEGEQARMVASALETTNPEMAAKVRTSGAAADLKDTQVRIQKMAEAHDQLASAEGTIHDATADQMKQIIASWDDKTKATVKSLIPNYQEEDPDLLKKQLSRLMLNAQGQNLSMVMADRERIAKMADDTRRDIAADRDRTLLMAKVLGKDGTESKADTRTTQQVMSAVEVDERTSTREIGKLHAATQEAALKARSSGWGIGSFKFGGGDAVASYNQAYQDEMDARKEVAQRVLDRYQTLPPGDLKNSMIEKQLKLLDIFETPPPDPKADAKDDKPKPSTQAASVKSTRTASGTVKDVPSNKSAPPEFKDPTAFDAKWKTLKSGETIIGPDGKPHTKK